MAFNKAIDTIRKHFGIAKLDDWRDVSPSWILDLEGVGPVTLDHVRAYLALRGVTLKDDNTPDHWRRNLDITRIGKTMTEDDLHVVAPFTVLVDAMEQQPFTFQNISVDISETPSDLAAMVAQGEIAQTDIKYVVPIEYRALGAAMGDYSIEGHQGRIHVERKSLEDAHGTILGWGKRRERFERELENLAAMEVAAIVIEASIGAVLARAPQHGKKTSSENRKHLHRQILAWQQDYRVPWFFCDCRQLAEVTTFRICQRYMRKQAEAAKRANKTAGDNAGLAELIAEL